METKNKIKLLIGDPNVVNVYQFGSHVYGTNHKDSDEDFIVVAKEFFDSNDINIHVFTRSQFFMALERYDIQALECIFADRKFVLKEDHKYVFYADIIDKSMLRTSISTIVSNSYVKCKKKLIVTGDYDLYLALKSFFHSLRILDFGIQIATEGRIVNYSSMNYIYADIFKMSETLQRDELWAAIDGKYREFYNKRNSIFKSLCPKNLTEINKKTELEKVLKNHDIEASKELIEQIINIFEK